jgi:EAL and modified HD-GYP domain-containing signal transduction protein
VVPAVVSTGTEALTGESYVHIGRQAIFDTAGAVAGYELLFRADPTAVTAAITDGHHATARVIVNTFTQFGLSALVGSGMAFINLTRPFLTFELPAPFVSDRVVLEVLEDLAPDAEVVEGCERLVAQGYRLALDDLSPNDQRLSLLGLASFAKLDFLACSTQELASIAAQCREAGVTLIAEKVETEGALNTAKALGCSLFQGHFLARAQVVSAPTLSPQRLQCLQLLGLLGDSDISLERINDVVSREPALALRILTVANSSAAGLNRRINTVRDALVMIGTRQLRSWLQLMLLADLSDENSELFATAVIRAKTCELLAEERGTVSGDQAFTVGLLSSLEEVLGQPLGSLVENMELDEDLHRALVSFDGPAGRLLAAVRRYEADRPQLGAEVSDVAIAFLRSVEWWHRGVPISATAR